MAHTPGDGLPASALTAFAKLRERFAAGLAQRWQEVSTAQPGAEQQAVLHRLAGVAGSFGYDAVGEAARQAEHRSMAGDQAGLAEALALLQQRIQEIGVTVR